MLLTHSPVAIKVLLLHVAPRLACVKPVASVHPEPGSNSSLLFCFVSFAQASSFSIVVLDGIFLRISTSSLYYFSCLCKCFQRTLLLCPFFLGTRVQRYYLFSVRQIFSRLFFIFLQKKFCKGIKEYVLPSRFQADNVVHSPDIQPHCYYRNVICDHIR